MSGARRTGAMPAPAAQDVRAPSRTRCGRLIGRANASAPSMENRMAAIGGLDRLSSEQGVQAANRVLAEKFGIADPAAAAGKGTALSGLDASNAAEIETLARKAAAGNRQQLGRLMAAALSDLAGREPAEKKRIEAAVKSAGAKQTVVGLDILALGYLLLCGYLAV